MLRVRQLPGTESSVHRMIDPLRSITLRWPLMISNPLLEVGGVPARNSILFHRCSQQFEASSLKWRVADRVLHDEPRLRMDEIVSIATRPYRHWQRHSKMPRTLSAIIAGSAATMQTRTHGPFSGRRRAKWSNVRGPSSLQIKSNLSFAKICAEARFSACTVATIFRNPNFSKPNLTNADAASLASPCPQYCRAR